MLGVSRVMDWCTVDPADLGSSMMVSGTLEMAEMTDSGPRSATVAGVTLTFSTVNAPPRKGESTTALTGTLRS